MARERSVSFEDVVEGAVERAIDRRMARLEALLADLAAKTPSQLLTYGQAAAALGVCTRTVRRMVASGELRTKRVGKNGVRIDSASIHGTAH